MEQIEEERLRWEFALKGNRDGVWDWNAVTNEVFFSQQWKATLGYKEHEIGTTLEEWSSRVHPEDLPHALESIRCYFEGQTEYYESEHRMRKKNGEYIWILDRGKIVSRLEDGSPLRVVGTHTDITSFKALEKELEEKERFISKVNEIGKMGGWWVDLATDEVRWTKSMYAIHELDESIHQPTREDGMKYFPPSSAVLLMEAFDKSVAECTGFDMIVPFITANGNDRWVRIVTDPICHNGVCTSVQGILQDITIQHEQTRKIESMNSLLESAKKDLEIKVQHRTRQLELTNSQLHQAIVQKEKLLTFISHEFQTPLHIMSLALQSMDGTLELPNPRNKESKFNAITKQILHLKDLTHQLMYLNKAEIGNSNDIPSLYTTVKVGELCRQAISYCQDVLNIGEEAQKDSPTIMLQEHNEDIRIHVERHLVFQILAHILQNVARHTSAQGVMNLLYAYDAVMRKVVFSISSADMIDGKDYTRHLEYNLVYLDVYVEDVQQFDLDLSLARRMIDACSGKVSVVYDQDNGLRVDISIPTHIGVIRNQNSPISLHA